MTNQSDRQESCRDLTYTALDYNGDWHALFDQFGIPTATYNERMLAFINKYTGSSFTELNSAMAFFANLWGVTDWNSLGTWGPALSFNFLLSTSLVSPQGIPFTFSRGTGAMQYNSNGLLTWGPENLALWSDALDNVYWTKLSVTVTPDQVASPFGGGVMADLVTEQIASNFHAVYRTNLATPSTWMTYSQVFKRPPTNANQWVYLFGYVGGVVQYCLRNIGKL